MLAFADVRFWLRVVEEQPGPFLPDGHGGRKNAMTVVARFRLRPKHHAARTNAAPATGQK